MFTRGKEQSDSSVPTYLIVGLGNPGREYAKTRHNIGFILVDVLAEAFGIRMMRVQSKAITGSGMVEGCKVILAKPQTYMNLSGESVSALMRFYKVPLENLIVLHDDLDLPFATIRLRPGGGSAGQKGIASIIERLGTQTFARFRFGIGRPPGQMDPAAYVLQDFSKVEQAELKFISDRVVQAIKVFMTSGLDAAMNQFNGSNGA